MVKSRKHIIQDEGQIAIDFPETFYMGSFGRDDEFEALAENDGLMIKLIRKHGEKRQAEVHLHHQLLADILTEWAASLKGEPPMSKMHRKTLISALKKVEAAI